MKIHLLFFIIILVSSCGFFDQEDPTKKKAKALLKELTKSQKKLESIVEEYSDYNSIPDSTATPEEVKLHVLGDASDIMYDLWKKKFENYQKQEVYMNYDRQVMALERLQSDLDKIMELLEKGEQHSFK